MLKRTPLTFLTFEIQFITKRNYKSDLSYMFRTWHQASKLLMLYLYSSVTGDYHEDDRER